MSDLTASNKVLPPYCNPDLDPKVPALATGTYNPTMFAAAYGGKKKTQRRRLTKKYKRSIKCKRPRSSSRKYGGRKRKTRNKRYRR